MCLCIHGTGVSGMFGCICGVVYSVFLLGPWGLLGFFIFLLFFPIQVCLMCSNYSIWIFKKVNIDRKWIAT